MRTITSPVTGTGGRAALPAFGGDDDVLALVTLARDLCDADLAAITVIGGERCHHVATVGLDPTVWPTEQSLCTHFAGVDKCVVVGDASYDDRFRHSPYVDGTIMRLRFYASAPICTAGHDTVARLVVYGLRPHGLDQGQSRALVTLAQTISRILEPAVGATLDPQVDVGDSPVADSISQEALRVAAQIGHDIRNPLTTMIATLEMLRESAPAEEDPRRVRLLATAERATHRLDSMVDGLLRLNRIGAPSEHTEVDLDEVARQVVEDSARMLEQAGAVVHLGNLPRLEADRAQIYSVLLNLLHNAVKFGRSGIPPVIGIQAWRTVRAWRVSVTDNGIGIPESERDGVFRMYARLDPTTDGHGIGLATVQRIVEAHGGTVGVGGEVGWGAEVWFELPDPE